MPRKLLSNSSRGSRHLAEQRQPSPQQVPPGSPDVTDHPAARATRHWLEAAVIGLNLCPFARQPWQQGRVRIRVSEATDPARLVDILCDELAYLVETDPETCETTLLVHPHVLACFQDYNDFLDVADYTLSARGLEGVVQIASFHPDYRFADTEDSDPANCTNRAPFPTLHLIRESSIEQALATMPEPERIYERNIERLRSLGWSGWQALMEKSASEGDFPDQPDRNDKQ